MKIDLSCVPLDTILLTKDYFEAEYGAPVTLNHVAGGVDYRARPLRVGRESGLT